MKQTLVIEDNDVDFLLIERAMGEDFTLSRALNLQDGLRIARSRAFDLIILDLSLGDSRGYETFDRARRAISDVPMLVLSGQNDESLALRAVANGAQDFVRKTNLLNCPLDRIAKYAVERHLSENRARHAEKQYRELCDNLPTAVFTCDAEGKITYFNRKAAEIWGREPNLNHPTMRFTGSFKLWSTTGEPIPLDQSWAARTLREGRAYSGAEIIIEQPSGERRHALTHTNPIFKNGTLVGAIVVLVDITHQREAERGLRESERLARSAVNALQSNIAIIDEHGKILSVNSAWQRFADENGMRCDGHCVGMNYLEVCERAAASGDLAAKAAGDGLRAVLAREKPSFELEYGCHATTDEHWVMMRATPFEGDGPMRVVVSHENITARKIAERMALEQCSLRQSVKGMEQVLGIVGHELRTPLAALRAITEFLTTEGSLGTTQAAQFLHDISDEVDRMSETVNNLLEAARLNSGRAKWNWSQFDLAAIVQDAIETVSPLVNSAAVQLKNSVADRAGEMLGDADAIRRLLVNLLSNARKYTERGIIEVKAVRHTEAGREWIKLVVSDTGCGIPQHILERMGEAFALNSGVVGSHHIRGTGLGLAICKGILTAHGGELLIESAEGKGTTVTARFRADLEVAAQGDTERVEPWAGVLL